MSHPAQTDNFITRYPRLGPALALHNTVPTALAEQYPQLLQMIDDAWGTAGGIDCIDHLLLSDRSDRQGFSDSIIKELMFIKTVYELTFPALTYNQNDPTGKLHTQETRAQLQPVSEQSAQGEPQSTMPRRDKWPHEIHTLGVLYLALESLEQGEMPVGEDRKRIGEYLIEIGAIDVATRDQALAKQSNMMMPHRFLGELMINDGTISRDHLNHALARQGGIPVVDAAAIEVTDHVMHLIPMHVALEKKAMPLVIHHHKIVVAVSDPFDVELQDYFSFVSGLHAVLVYARPESIKAAWHPRRQ